jgi:molybdate transport system permease protein
MLTPEEWSALGLSVRAALCGVVVMLAPGVACAWVLARKEFRGKAVADAVIHLPLVLPPVVVGYVLLMVLGRRGVIGGWLHDAFGVELAFTWTGAAVAAGIMGFPLLVRALRLSIELIDVRIEEAARTLGAGPWRVFVTITLPMALPGLLAGVLMAGARALGEFGATITFAGNIEGETRTIPLAIYTATQVPDGDAAALRLVAISVGLALGAMVVSEMLARKAHRKIGRRA